MEVRDPIHGSIDITEGEVQLLDTPQLQRLRNIKQLGFADLAFPGATHARYLHSIGTMFLAGRAFDSIFKHHRFRRRGTWKLFRQLVRLGALLHDVGHAPLSHCAESAMPPVSRLDLRCLRGRDMDRRATHEDYGLKFITDSDLAGVIARSFPVIQPDWIAALLNLELPLEEPVFVDGGVDFRTVLAQIISSELDADRMDYLRRDSYFAGVSYGAYDVNWILSNLTFHVTDAGKAHLALDPRALYTFNDFLIARFHMFLMVYFHHKPVIFEEMLKRYFESPEGTYAIPADIDAYVGIDDYHLYHHLREEARKGHPWAKRIVDRNPYRLLREWHGTPEEIDIGPVVAVLEGEHIPLIATSSTGSISKYTRPTENLREGPPIYSVEKRTGMSRIQGPVRLLEERTDLFAKYEERRQISRIYVPREYEEKAFAILARHRDSRTT